MAVQGIPKSPPCILEKPITTAFSTTMNQIMLRGINLGRCDIGVVKQIRLGIKIRRKNHGRSDIPRLHRPFGFSAGCDQFLDKLQKKSGILWQDHKIGIWLVSYLSRQFLIVRKILIDK